MPVVIVARSRRPPSSTVVRAGDPVPVPFIQRHPGTPVKDLCIKDRTNSAGSLAALVVADSGLKPAMERVPELRPGLKTYAGNVINPRVADTFDLPHHPNPFGCAVV